MKIIKGCLYRGKISEVVVESLETVETNSKINFTGRVVSVTNNSKGYTVGHVGIHFSIDSFELVQESEVIKLEKAVSVIVTDYLNNVSSDQWDLFKYIKSLEFENKVIEQLKQK